MSKMNMNEPPLILQSLQAMKDGIDIVPKKGEAIRKKSMVTDIATKTAVIGDLFMYHKRKYICLGARADDRWITDTVYAIKLKEYQAKKGILTEEDIVSIKLNDEALEPTFQFPMMTMPGHCRGYWMDIKKGVYHIIFEKNKENYTKTQETKMVKKSRHKELMSV